MAPLLLAGHDSLDTQVSLQSTQRTMLNLQGNTLQRCLLQSPEKACPNRRAATTLSMKGTLEQEAVLENSSSVLNSNTVKDASIWVKVNATSSNAAIASEFSVKEDQSLHGPTKVLPLKKYVAYVRESLMLKPLRRCASNCVQDGWFSYRMS
jgi:hypothetical protein